MIARKEDKSKAMSLLMMQFLLLCGFAAYKNKIYRRRSELCKADYVGWKASAIYRLLSVGSQSGFLNAFGMSRDSLDELSIPFVKLWEDEYQAHILGR